MDTSTHQADIRKMINMLVVLFFMFVFRFIPPISTLTPMGMHVLGIFIGAIYGWSTVDLIWPGFFAVISMSFVEGFTLTSIIVAGFGSTIFWTICFMSILVFVFEKAGGTNYIATWFITRKFLQGRPLLFVFFFLFADFLVGMLNGIVALLLFCNILFQVCEKVGYAKKSKFPTLMIFGIALIAMFGSISHSLAGSPLILAGAFTAASGVLLTLIDFLKVCWVIGVFLTVVFTLSLKFVFRCDLQPLANVDMEAIVDKGALAATKELKLMAVYIVLLIAAILAMYILPKTLLICRILNALSILGLAMIVLGLMSATRVNGRFLFDFRDYTNTILWDCLFICAVVMPLSGMLTMEGTGINDFVSSVLGGVIGNLPPYAFVCAVIFIGMVLTNLGNNVSICILLMPVIFSIGSNLGLDPRPIYMCLIFAVHLALLTPGACPYAAMVWGNTEWITPKAVYKYVPVIMFILYVFLVTAGYAWARFMFSS